MSSVAEKVVEKEEKNGFLAVAGYAAGEIGCEFVWAMVAGYLAVFYTDVVGILPAAVSVLFLVTRVWDAANDPLMGMIADRTSSKFGRLRPYVLFGSPVLALFAILTFTVPGFLGSAGAKLAWAYFTYIFCGMAYTLVAVPYMALPSVMSFNKNGRLMLTTARYVGLNGGRVMMNIVTPILILAAGGTATAGGYTKSAVLFALISIPLLVFCGVTVKETVKPIQDMKKVTLKTTLGSFIKNKYLVRIVLFNFFNLCGAMGKVSLGMYYFIYVLKRPDKIAVLMTVPTICSIFTIMIAKRISRKVEKRRIVMTALAGTVLAALGLFFTPYGNFPLVLAFSVMYGVCSFYPALTSAMVADAVDYGEDKFGARIDATAYAMMGFATKLATAVAPAIGLAILGAVGYVARQAQTPVAMRGINISANLLPALFYALSFITMAVSNLSDSDAADIRGRLQAKKAAAQQ
jgi:GPH family glycoside/pentoside/hexuronide:cation symporter/probable glucitol transport protein GutA